MRNILWTYECPISDIEGDNGAGIGVEDLVEHADDDEPEDEDDDGIGNVTDVVDDNDVDDDDDVQLVWR